MKRKGYLDTLAGILYFVLGLGLGWMLGFRWLLLFWVPLLGFALLYHLADDLKLAGGKVWQFFFALFLAEGLCVTLYQVVDFPRLAYVLAALVTGLVWIASDQLLLLLLMVVTPPLLMAYGRLLGLGEWWTVPALLLAISWTRVRERLEGLEDRLFAYEHRRTKGRWILYSASHLFLGLAALVSTHAAVSYEGKSSFLEFLIEDYSERYLIPWFQLPQLPELSFSLPASAEWLSGLMAVGLFAASLALTAACLRVCCLWLDPDKDFGWKWIGSISAVLLVASITKPLCGWASELCPESLGLGYSLVLWGLLGLVSGLLARRPLAGLVSLAATVLAGQAILFPELVTVWDWLPGTLAVWLGLGTLLLAITPLGLGPAILAHTGLGLLVREIHKPVQRSWHLVGHKCGNCHKPLPGKVPSCPHCGVRFGGERNEYSGGSGDRTEERSTKPVDSLLILLFGWCLPATGLSVLSLLTPLAHPALVEFGLGLALLMLFVVFRLRCTEALAEARKVDESRGEVVLVRVVKSWI